MDQSEIRRFLGSTGPAEGTFPVAVFLPDCDKDGEPIDQAYWGDLWLKHLAGSFRGGTGFPPGRGAWRAEDGTILLEDTAVLFSMAAPGDVTEESMIALGEMARQFGREANQAEVGLWINGVYHPITDF